MYKTLKTIRQRDSKGKAPSESFRAEKFKIHFEKLGANKHEQEHDKMEEIIDWISDQRDDPIASKAGEWLAKPLTVAEFLREWKLMTDGAAGKDSVTTKTIRNNNINIRIEMAGRIVELREQDPCKWHTTLN